MFSSVLRRMRAGGLETNRVDKTEIPDRSAAGRLQQEVDRLRAVQVVSEATYKQRIRRLKLFCFVLGCAVFCLLPHETPPPVPPQDQDPSASSLDV
jgi:hypothetical protein